VKRVGKLELRVPQDRHGRFSTEVFERYQRSEKALVLALGEMYVQGVSTRKVKAITEQLCGHEFSASTISRINKTLDSELDKFARRKLEEPYPYLILDARYEKVREDGVIRRRAVLIGIGINWEGRRCVLGVDVANRETSSSWRTFLEGLRKRGLSGIEFVVSDDHAGLKRPVAEILPEAAWQRCYVHFLRNALDYPRGRLTTTAGRSYGGCMTGTASTKLDATWPRGSTNGRRSTRSSVTGSKKTSRKR